ncbi:MAG: BMP family ABC transporter substrate-binding protein [Chloroflexota bacterium]
MRIKLICLLAIVLLSIPACTPAPDCSRKDVFCAALVTDTRGLNDYGINQDTWAGLQQAKVDGVVNQIAYIESVDTRDYQKNINFFVNAGYDVIVTSGIGLRAATLRSADLYPASVFVGMNQADNESVSNFISVTFPEDQMGFFAGALAAHLTHTNIIGAVCEDSSLDSMWRYCEGFRAGAKYINGSAALLIIYRDNGSSDKLFIDDAWGTESAQTLIKRGADVIFAVGGETGVGALRTVAQAGVKSIGAERDQRAALGDQGASVVTSVLGSASSTVETVLRNIQHENLADMTTSPFRFVSMDSVAPQSLIEDMHQILLSLTNGEIEPNVTQNKP